MAIYIVMLLICLSMAMVAYQKTYIDSRGKIFIPINVRYKPVMIFLAVFFLLTVGLRSSSVGIDTQNYMNTFLRVRREGFTALRWKKWYDEAGYTLCIILFGKLGLSWQFFCFFMAALYIVPIMYLISEKTNNAFWAFAIFIMAGFWTYPMSTMRQAAAMGIAVIAVLNRNKPVLCAILLAAAFSFHVSALIVLVYLAIIKIPLRRSNLLMWGMIGIGTVLLATGPLRSVFFSIMKLFGRTYMHDSAVGGTMTELFFCATVVIGAVYAGDFSDTDYINGLKAIFLAAVTLPIVRINPALFRVYSYFSVYQIIFVPQMLTRINERTTKVAGYVGYTAAYLYLFITQVMVKSLRVTPYQFFWGSLFK